MKILSAAFVAVAGRAAMTMPGCHAVGIEGESEQEAIDKKGKYSSVNSNVELSSDGDQVSVYLLFWVNVSYPSTQSN